MALRTQSDELAFRLAQRSVELIIGDSSLCQQFAEALGALRDRNGPKAAYEKMEAACKDRTLLCAMLLDESEDGNVIRSVAPFYAVLPEDERQRIIRSLDRVRGA